MTITAQDESIGHCAISPQKPTHSSVPPIDRSAAIHHYYLYGETLDHPDEMRVPLTTVSQHSGQIGATAVDLLMRRQAGQDVEDVLIPTELARRASIKDLRNKPRRR